MDARVLRKVHSGGKLGPGVPGATWRWRPRFPLGIAALASVSFVVFGACWLLDASVLGRRIGPGTGLGPLRLLFELDPGTLQNQLGSLAQVIVAVLGIAITVVSIVVQLAATRYTPRIAEMFFRDKTNLAVMGFFVVACLNSVWVTLAVGEHYVPTATVTVTVAMASTSLLLLVPYFAYVFDFLDPGKVIVRIGEQVLRPALAARARAAVVDRQVSSAASMEHLADVAVNALAQKDRHIASQASFALRDSVVRYVAEKSRLGPDWFTVGDSLRRNPDFVAMDQDLLRALEQQRAWLEWKALRHLCSVFSESLNYLPEMAHVVAIETRYVGEAAVAHSDPAVLELAVKYFNTFMRTAINARDVRACYNVLNQYRLLAEAMIEKGLNGDAHAAARHLAYYGQLARTAGLSFVTETVAHDLGTLCERAFEKNAACHDRVLDVFLEVDKEAETAAEEKALRGVRKAQLKLATYYLVHDALTPARRIAHDMRQERPERLASIRAELAGLGRRDFWEITDRGVNFDYLDDARKSRLGQFFEDMGLR
jgi:hypothetical protein